MNRCHFPLIIVVPGDPVTPGDFESLVIRETEISLWRNEGSDLGGWQAGPEEAPLVSLEKPGISDIILTFSP